MIEMFLRSQLEMLNSGLSDCGSVSEKFVSFTVENMEKSRSDLIITQSFLDCPIVLADLLRNMEKVFSVSVRLAISYEKRGETDLPQ